MSWRYMEERRHGIDIQAPSCYPEVTSSNPRGCFLQGRKLNNYVPSVWIAGSATHWHMLHFLCSCHIPLGTPTYCENIYLKVQELGGHMKCWGNTNKGGVSRWVRNKGCAAETTWTYPTVPIMPSPVTMADIINWSWHSFPTNTSMIRWSSTQPYCRQTLPVTQR